MKHKANSNRPWLDKVLSWIKSCRHERGGSLITGLTHDGYAISRCAKCDMPIICTNIRCTPHLLAAVKDGRKYNTIDELLSKAIDNGDVLIVDRQSYAHALIPKDRFEKAKNSGKPNEHVDSAGSVTDKSR